MKQHRFSLGDATIRQARKGLAVSLYSTRRLGIALVMVATMSVPAGPIGAAGRGDGGWHQRSLYAPCAPIPIGLRTNDELTASPGVEDLFMTKTSQAPARSRAGSASKGRNGSKPPDARGAKGRKKKAPDHELDQDMDPELQEQFIAALGNLTGGIDSVGAVLLWNLLIACVPERHRQRDRYHLAGFMWLIEQRSDDPIEMLLKIQLWVAHITAMDCLAHATLTNQSFDGRNMELKHAERFLNLSVRLEQALARRGGRPQQTVRVEHLSVAPGGQAVVANVQAAANVANRDMPSQLAPGDAASDATPRPPSARQGVA